MREDNTWQGVPYCVKFNLEDIKDVSSIPEWCPLEDSKDETQ